MSDKSWPTWLPIRPSLKHGSAYGAPQLPVEIKLNTNENPFGLSDDLIDKILTQIKVKAATLNRYPDRDAVDLRKKLAKFINKLSGTKFNESNIWTANGSNEIIQSIFLAFGGKGALGFEPSYSVHKIIANTTQTTWKNVNRNKDFSLNLTEIVAEINRSKPSITFLTTPNNPTGTSAALDEIKQIAQTMKSVNGLLVIDEAYAEFSKLDSAVTLINQFENIVVIRTMSKAFAFAGVRLGYLVANPQVIDALMLVGLPYHLSSLTQSAAEVALDSSDQLLNQVSTLVSTRNKLSSELKALGLTVIPSEANFILFTGFASNPSVLWQGLVERGVLIRDVGLSGYLRVTVGTESENSRFISELKLLMNGDTK